MKVVPNPVGIAALNRRPETVAGLGEVAARGAAAAQEIASSGYPGEVSHDYHDGLEGQAGIEGGKAKGRINAKDWKSWFVEAGTSDTPAFAVLRRACDAIGLKIEA